MQAYGWYLQHRYSGMYLAVEMGSGGPSITATQNLKDATRFDTHVHARDVLAWLMQDADVDYSVVDYAIFDAPTPDADQTPVRSYQEVLDEAVAAKQAEIARRVHVGGNGGLSDTPPMGEQQRMTEAEKPKGYGVGGFAITNSPLFPSRPR